MTIDRTLVKEVWQYTEESEKQCVFWVTLLYWVDESAQRVWNFHMSSELWREHLNCSGKQCQENHV